MCVILTVTGIQTEPVRTTSSGSSEIPVVELAHQANITHTSHKKLTKFFGEDIPKVENLQTFLNRLGYPELMNVSTCSSPCIL